MKSEWERVALSEFVGLQRGHDLTAEERRPGAVPVMGSAGRSGWHDTARTTGPGVVIGRSGVGSMGAVHYCPVPFWPHNTTLYVTDFHGNDPLFTYFALKSINFRRFDSGSAQSSLNRNYLANIPVLRPPIGVQREIASVLGSLNSRIEVGRTMSQTLDSMALALFRSWFVDFHPVRAKADGRSPKGRDATVEAMFPSRFEPDLGGSSVPVGWRSALVGSLVTVTKGVSYKSAELKPSRTALVTLKSIRRGGGYRADGLKPFVGEHRAEQEVRPGELVVAQTDLTQAADVIGKPALIQPSPDFDRLVASLDLLIVRPIEGLVPVEFLYLMFMQPEFQQHAYGHSNGSTVLHLGKNAVPTYRFQIPPASVLDRFAALVRPLVQRAHHSEVEAGIIEQARDTLVPVLLSGEIRLGDAEAAVGKAV